MGWYDECYRKLFLDYHTQQNATEVGACFDAEKWAETLRETGIQAVSCISKCGYGWRYYRRGSIGRVHPHLPEGTDILDETVRACHARNIRVISYVHTFGSEYIAAEKPEWLRRDQKGNSWGNSVCMLGPALEEEMLPQLAEIAGNYDIDGIFLDGTYHGGGICYCESCRERFLRECGAQLPTNKNDASYPLYLKWIEEAYIKVRCRCCEVVSAANPKVLLSVNWAYTTRQIEEIPEEIGFMTKDISPADMACGMSFQARNWALTGVPFDVMNHLSLKWWQEWSVKPINSLIAEAALVLVNGGKTWMGYQMYPWFAVEPYLLESLRKTCDFIRSIEPILSGSSVVPYVGVLHGESQIRTNRTGDFSIFAKEDSLLGVHRSLTLSGIPYNSAVDSAFLKHLNEFSAVVISGNQYVAPAVMDAVEKYVAGGGSLFVTGKSGMINETGAFAPESLMAKMAGIKVTEEYPYSHGYIRLPAGSEIGEGVPDMPILSSQTFTFVRPVTAAKLAETVSIYVRSDGKTLFNSETSNRQSFSPPGKLSGSAAITLNKYGRGTVVYCATDIFSAYAGNSQWCLKKIIKNIVNKLLLGGRAITLDAPDYVETALTRIGNTLYLHMVNLVRESPAVDFGAPTEYIIGEDIIPIRDIKISVPATVEPKSVKLAPTGESLDWTYSDGMVSFVLPKLDVYSCVAIEPAF